MTILKEKNQFHIDIPRYVQYILDELNDAGYEAYIVGGCVRDALLGREPGDWDVCTSALPTETLVVFGDERTIETGLKHGTVTVVHDDNPVEVTTYRIDGEYLDGRHPEKVEFTRSLKEDLARRDFTINAMAYHPKKGLVDLYGGRQDLEEKIIRCVGEPDKRFAEDSLRIMRGLRFSAQLGFSVEEVTLAAMNHHITDLDKVSRERIQVELSKLLLGEYADDILGKEGELLEKAIQGLAATTIGHLPSNLAIRLAEVFPKDTAKHLRKLKYDGNTIRWARVLSRLRDTPALTEPKKEMVRFLKKHGKKITILHYARAGEAEATALYRLLQENPCYRIQDLAISGNDLIEQGMKPGPEMGEILKQLLDLVIEEKVKNERNELLDAAKEAMKHE